MSYFDHEKSIDMDIFEHIRCIENDIFNQNRIQVGGGDGIDLSSLQSRFPSILTNLVIQGRTLINLLGRRGNHIYKPQLQLFNCTSSFDVNEMVVTMDPAASTSQIKYNISKLENNSRYILIGDFKQQYLSEGAMISPVNDSIPFGTVAKSSNVVYFPGHDLQDEFISLHITNTNWKTHWLTFDTNKELVDATININLNSNVDGKLYVKNLRMYQISDDEFKRIIAGDIDVDYIYPYVDDIKGVVNPYIRSIQNLIDEPNWIIGNPSTTLPLTQIYNKDSNEVVSVPIKLQKGTYTYNLNKLKDFKDPLITNLTVSKPPSRATYFASNNNSVTFDMDVDGFIIIAIKGTNNESASTILSIINSGIVYPTLVKGDTKKEYADCINSEIIFNTTLYEGETLYKSNNGGFVKNSIWCEEIITGSNPIPIVKRDLEGYVTLGFYCKSTYATNDCYVVDSNGDFLRHPYCGVIDSNGSGSSSILFVCIPDSKTGWESDYLPNYQEISTFLNNNNYKFFYKKLYPSIEIVQTIGTVIFDKNSVVTIGDGKIVEARSLSVSPSGNDIQIHTLRKPDSISDVLDSKLNHLMFYTTPNNSNESITEYGNSNLVVIDGAYVSIKSIYVKYNIMKQLSVSVFNYSISISENIIENIKDQCKTLLDIKRTIDSLNFTKK